MKCAICLYEQVITTVNREPNDALTIVNGQAVCDTHFATVAAGYNHAGGGTAISLLQDPRFKHA